jgi:hypothetical protein
MYLCDECKQDFGTMSDLTIHYKKEHPKAHKRLTKDVSC